jgi:hypothetical protein
MEAVDAPLVFSCIIVYVSVYAHTLEVAVVGLSGNLHFHVHGHACVNWWHVAEAHLMAYLTCIYYSRRGKQEAIRRSMHACICKCAHMTTCNQRG